MSSKENNEVAVEKIDNDKGLEGKCELKGTKRAAEVIKPFLHFSYLCCYIVDFRTGLFVLLLSPRQIDLVFLECTYNILGKIVTGISRISCLIKCAKAGHLC